MINPPEAKPRNPLSRFKGFGLLAVGVTAAIAGAYAIDRAADANIVAQMPPSMAQVMVMDSVNIIAGAESGFMYGMMGAFEQSSGSLVGHDFNHLKTHFMKNMTDREYVKAGVTSQLDANLSEDDLVVLGLEVATRHEKMLSLLNDAADALPKDRIGDMDPKSVAALYIINEISDNELSSHVKKHGHYYRPAKMESTLWQDLDVDRDVTMRLVELFDDARVEVLSPEPITINLIGASVDPDIPKRDETFSTRVSEWEMAVAELVKERLDPHMSAGSSPFIQVANAINKAPNRIFGDGEGRNLARANIADPFEDDVRPGLVQDLVDVVVGKHPDDPFTTVEIEPKIEAEAETPEHF
jgi:hypothetical protein